MKVKKMLTLMLAGIFTMSVTGSAEAKSSNPVFGEQSEEVEISLENGVADETLIDVSELSHVSMDNDVSEKVIDVSDLSLKDATYIGEFPKDGVSVVSSPYSVTQSFNGIIDKEGGIAYLNVTLFPTDILQATLSGPVNADIDYDLLLYAYDSNGNIDLSKPVDSSKLYTKLNEYGDGSIKTVEEGISYINETEQNQTYAVIVNAFQGYSTTEPFTLTISLDEAGFYDQIEPNDSIYHYMYYKGYQAKVTGVNLNVPNDQDWYCWDVPVNMDMVRITLDNPSYQVEVYQKEIEDGEEIDALTLVKANGLYSLKAGKYWIRVYNTNSSFVSAYYTLSLKPRCLIPATITHSFNGDMDTGLINYGQGAFYRFDKAFRLGVYVKDDEGFVITKDTATVYWQRLSAQGEWGTPSSKTLEIDKGNGVVSIYPADALGLFFSQPGTVGTHYYDILKVTIVCGDASEVFYLYHFAYSDV